MILPPNFTLLQVAPALETGGVEQTALDVAAAVFASGGRALVASSGGRLERALVDLGGEAVRMPVQSKNPLVVAANALRLKALIRREGVSLIHARSRAPAFSAQWAARAAGIPFVATYAGAYSAGSGLKRWYNGVMTRGDLVIANSNFTRDHLIAEHRVAPDKVVAIPRGIDLDAFDPAAVAPERVAALRRDWGLDARPVLLLAARLTRWKGHGLLLEALSRSRAAGGGDVTVVFAGDDQGRTGYRAELEAQVLRLGLSDRVRLVGHCADMPAAYLAADLAAAPSLQPEAFGRTAVEPQAMGRPVLAADHGATRETMVDGRTGWLVPPGDAAAWAGALDRALAAGPGAWRRMGDEGRVRVRALFSVEAMTRATLEAYVRLLASRASAAE
ncbi:MAG TPA: glycosyltransferase family 4 protein [Caulobacteraceae bacterium]|jgi:glycosyltransferase involved in cell wall biosynthesis|nr:glycosyltransferase family 4 protein [Caulobacteraceae bacterium]